MKGTKMPMPKMAKMSPPEKPVDHKKEADRLMKDMGGMMDVSTRKGTVKKK